MPWGPHNQHESPPLEGSFLETQQPTPLPEFYLSICATPDHGPPKHTRISPLPLGLSVRLAGS